MTNEERTAKITHYEWMLATLTLNPLHEDWIHNELYDLRRALRQGVTA
jgi:hypothetical protein